MALCKALSGFPRLLELPSSLDNSLCTGSAQCSGIPYKIPGEKGLHLEKN